MPKLLGLLCTYDGKTLVNAYGDVLLFDNPEHGKVHGAPEGAVYKRVYKAQAIKPKAPKEIK